MIDNRDEMIRYFRNVFTSKNSRVNQRTLEWLVSNGFFDAPASRSYHLNFKGGLFNHSFNVCNTLCVFTKNMPLSWQDKESHLIVGMFHDLCKIDLYKETADGYEYNSPILSGHGDKSILILSTLMTLTEEEMYCIRYHMDSFSDDPKERSAYSRAVEKYPNVLFTHTADMYASHVFEMSDAN